MPRKQSTIGRAELQILNYIQQHHPIPVREVAEHFARTNGQARTTILNVMTRLWRKGYLARRQSDGVFRYSPRSEKQQVLRSVVGDFVQKMLNGSVSPFVAYLAEEADLSESDLQELKAIVRQLDGKRGEK
jgi:predicted transcriptional regulator